MKKNPALWSEEYLRTIIERQNVDVLFECFAGLLIRSKHLEANQIHVIPKENENRNFKNDIIPTRADNPYEVERYFKENERDLLIMYTSRSAILDYLPEDFYSEPDNTSEFSEKTGEKRSKEDIEKYRERVKEELKSAKRFFTPLEIEYNKVRIERELSELDQLENYDQTLTTFWKNFSLINVKWKRFVRTLHLTSFVIGDKDKTKALIEFVLGTQVTLDFDIEDSCEMNTAQQKALTGDVRTLGFNVNIGHTVYDYLEICTLTIKDLSTDEFFNYFEESSEDKILLSEIIKYYFPLNIDVRLNFSIQPKERKPDEPAEIPILGYSSKLGVV